MSGDEKRLIPNARELAEALSPALHHAYDAEYDVDGTFTVDETDVGGTGPTIEVSGETEEGVRFAFLVTISNVREE